MFQTYSFPNDEEPDSEIVARLGLRDPLTTLTFKAPQLLAHWFGLRAKRFIMSLDKGMGKTVTYLSVAQSAGVERLIILCTLNAMLAQRREIKRHFPQWASAFVFVQGTAIQREKLWNDMHARVFIIPYATFLADMGVRAKSGGRVAPKWVDKAECIICDEYHRVLRNKGTKMHTLLKKVDPNRLILSSGSAANKGPHSMWVALNLCDPKLWSSYWKYVYTYCVVEDTNFGKQITGVKNIAAWRNAIAPYVFHRKKDLKDYPKKTRQALDVEVEPWQMKIHNDLKKQLMAAVGNDLVIAKNSLHAMMLIRQFMMCPKFIDPSLGYGAGLEAILADVQDSELSHFVISVPYIGPIPLIRQFFEEAGIHTESLQGGIDTDEQESRILRWQKKGGCMVQSIQYAESYELPPARIMYFLGYSHDPEQNSQAEDRIVRDLRVTPHPVDVYYVKHLRTYDEEVVDAMSTHADNVYNLMNRPLKEVFDLWGDN